MTRQIILFVLLAFNMSCASKPLNKDDQDILKPKELPKELFDKFEVKEIQAGADSIIEKKPTLPKPTKKSTKKKKKLVSQINVNPLPTPLESHIPSPLPKEEISVVFPPMPSPSPNFMILVRRPEKDPIKVSEQMVYEITYFGIAAGDFVLTVLPFKSVNNRKVYHFQGHAMSSKLFSLFYRVNDWVETFVDYEGWFSHRFHLTLDETKQTRDSLELNDSERKKSFYWNRWNHKTRGYTEIKDFFSIEPFPQDSLSALYYLRTLTYEDQSEIRFPVASEGKCWFASVTLDRREILKTPLGKIPSIVLKIEAQYQGVLKKSGDSFLWLSDDERRIPLRLEAKVKIGTVVSSIKNYKPGL
ncbi:MAG: DUF3108 domain-containing protein [Bdellovibrio sp.]|nr:DUF3108 domain-containing protein [Bdellovibrio sp.]